MATKNQTNDNPIESAEKTLANLIAKRNKAAALREKDDAELASVSYHAHTGDRDAVQKLDAIRERSVKREVDIKSLDAAIAMAKQNVEAAKQPEAAEVERLAATELLGLCKVLREAGKQADAALSMLGEAAVTMSDTVTAINRLGATHRRQCS
jgi:uncharacterized protein YajQ (UPF0234 family)